jgi:hypothetical protein
MKNNAIWAITSLYRFFPSPYRESNFWQFRDQLKKQNVPLAVIEITTDHTQPLLKQNDVDLLVQIKTSSFLWHKERSLNLLLKHLPPACQYVAWLDSDCILLDNNWPSEATNKLKEHKAIQLCSSIDFLDQDNNITFSRNTYAHNIELRNNNIPPPPYSEGSPGFCWMMGKKELTQIQLFDKTIIGGGDLLFADAMCNTPLNRLMLSNGNPEAPIYKNFTAWRGKANTLLHYKKAATTLPGNSQHLFHDERKYRLYGMRHYLLLLENYNPHTDLSIEPSGLYKLTNPRLASLLHSYFWLREQEKTKELDNLFSSFEILMEHLKNFSHQQRLDQRKKRLEELKSQRKFARNLKR